MSRLIRDLAQEIVVDVRLAAGNQRPQLGEVDDVEITLAKDGELDRSGGPVRHGVGGDLYQAPQGAGRARPPVTNPLSPQVEPEAGADPRTGDLVHPGLQ